MERSSNEMIKGAAILTLAAFFSKILSALYRVPFQNIVGDTGFYIYQQVYPFYGILLALCTYTFPVMISKMVAEQIDTGKKEDVSRILQVSFLFLTAVGLGWFLALRFGAEALAVWMGDPSLAPLIGLMAYPFLLLPILSTGKGWFQANQNMVPSALSQGLEQFVRVVVILVLSIVLMTAEAGLYAVGMGAVAGSIAGSFTGVVVLTYFVWKQGVRIERVQSLKFSRFDWMIVRKLTIMGGAIGMGSMMLVLYQLVDALNVYAMLVAGGVEQEAAKEIKGVYDRGQPLVQMGIIVATSLSLTVVPMISSAYEKNQHEYVKEKAKLALKIGIIFGAAAAVGLINIIIPLNIMLFQDSSDSHVLAVFVLSALMASIILTISAVLQGMGSFHLAAWSIVASLAVKYGLNQWLVPYFGTLGAAIATVLAMLLVLIVVVMRLRRRVGRLLERSFYRVLAVSLFGMTAAIQLLMVFGGMIPPELASTRVQATLMALLGAALGGWVFMFVTWKQRLFTNEEVKQIPLGKKLDRIFGSSV
ncbi:hypothetical protein KP78_00530 [Jeotgalibacillus soli]|uniref:Uncharacterized protein n=2 Tax=Jeotgalibacillus soli TaxID=889306 RepID=A0A0C2W930_9BACL|nr:hypothetical protein KP78_00530 [Jeotgalibacillus soli]